MTCEHSAASAAALTAATLPLTASRETDAPSTPASLPVAAIHEDPGVAARTLTFLAGCVSQDVNSGLVPARKALVREGGVWREDKERTGRNFRTWHATEVHLLRDIHDASHLLRPLVEDSRKAPLFTIPGIPSREIIAHGGAGVQRNAVNFVDAEKHLVWLDGDGLPLPEHLIEDVQDHPDFPAVVAAWPRIVEWIAREVLPSCFHGITILAYPTAKNGLMARDRAFIRLCFWSARPLASAQCKALVAWINAECLRSVAEWQKYADANPSWQPFDDSIYSPEHILLTAAPELIDRDRALSFSVPYQRRFIDLIGDVNELVLPEAALVRVASVLSGGTSCLPSRSKRKAGGAAVRPAQGRKATAADLLGALAPGNYRNPIRDIVGKRAVSTPAHRAEEVLATLRTDLVKRIEETSEPADRERRVREHADPVELRRLWDGTIAGAKYDYPAVAPVDPVTETGSRRHGRS